MWHDQRNGTRAGRRMGWRWLAAGMAGVWALADGTARHAEGAEQAAAGITAGSLPPSYDVVIAGAGTGGIGAAIQAARLGVSVLLLEETDWIGGQMLAAAVSAMDEGGAGNLVRERGLYRELVQRIQEHYGRLGKDPFRTGRMTNTRVEPRVGRELVSTLLAEAGGGGRLDLLLRARVNRVLRSDTVVQGVEIAVAAAGEVARTVRSRILVDATEWGDVLPLAGARYRAGNHSSEALDLRRNIQENTWTAVIRQYAEGVPAELRLARPPPGYDAIRGRFQKVIVPGDAPQRRGEPMSWVAFLEYRGMPDRLRPGADLGVTRTHLNFSNDYPCTVEYLEVPAKRVAVGRAMRLRTLQLLYYLQHDLGKSDWSVANDEGFDTAYNRGEVAAWIQAEPEMAEFAPILRHFSVMPYVRESRRLVGLHTLRAAEISRGPGRAPRQFPGTLALGDYRLDLHGGRAAADLELDLDRLEDLEDAQPGRAGPFAIPGECLIPERLDGLLAAEKNFSQTRLVNGATRMQPHTLNLGQAAGALAALAVRHGVQPREVDLVLVQRILLAAGATLNLTPLRDVAPEAADWPAIQLVTVHGLLPLEGGRFEPRRAVRTGELAHVRSYLGASDGAGSPAAGEVSRGEWADAMARALGTAVRIDFSASGENAHLPITRSEAAQVLAEGLELRALARLRRQPQILTWNTVRPTSAVIAWQDVSKASPYLRPLLAAGILTDADYWMNQTGEGKDCDGGRMQEVLRRAALAIDPTHPERAPLAVLVEAQIIRSPDYWAKSAVPDGQCTGRNVAALLRNLSSHPAIVRRAGVANRP